MHHKSSKQIQYLDAKIYDFEMLTAFGRTVDIEDTLFLDLRAISYACPGDDWWKMIFRTVHTNDWIHLKSRIETVIKSQNI